eukprot:m.12605 g.12605  ORF g.12605 m.12605 type:complete len:260 (+) comp7825_c0_seq1:259-1038(+)
MPAFFMAALIVVGCVNVTDSMLQRKGRTDRASTARNPIQPIASPEQTTPHEALRPGSRTFIKPGANAEDPTPQPQQPRRKGGERFKKAIKKAIKKALKAKQKRSRQERGAVSVVTATGVRTCNPDSPVLETSPRLTVLLAPQCTQATLSALIDRGLDALAELVRTADKADLAAAGAVIAAIGADQHRDVDGHATIVTNDPRYVVLPKGEDALSQSARQKVPVFIKIIATNERVWEIQQLMECAFDDVDDVDGLPKRTEL